MQTQHVARQRGTAAARLYEGRNKGDDDDDQDDDDQGDNDQDDDDQDDDDQDDDEGKS